MYTHARQFPHLADMSDAQIREIVRRGMGRRLGLARMMRLRNSVAMIGMVLAAAGLARFSAIDLGLIFMLVGGIATAVILAWNLVWVNTVLFHLTREEVGREAT
jgi:hypothetical protein